MTEAPSAALHVADPAMTDPAGGGGVEPPWWRRPGPRRVVGMLVFAVAFGVFWATVGLPTDPLAAIGWLWAATIAWNNTRPWRHHLRFARDWLPVAVVLVLYTYSRAWAYGPHTVPHVAEMLAIDHAIFGVTPTVWLQQHLYDPHHIHPWDVAVSFVYFSHFVTCFTIAVVLWLRSRPLWAAFMRRWIVLTLAGLATYALFPAAPPWWAAKNGLIPPVARLSARGWSAIGLHGAGNVLSHTQDLANPVAAMPSLHFAFTCCAVGFFLPRVRWRFRPLLCAYPAAMAFTLSYCGEHHVTDMIAGLLYVVATFAAVSAAERALRRRGGRRGRPGSRGCRGRGRWGRGRGRPRWTEVPS